MCSDKGRFGGARVRNISQMQEDYRKWSFVELDQRIYCLSPSAAFSVDPQLVLEPAVAESELSFRILIHEATQSFYQVVRSRH